MKNYLVVRFCNKQDGTVAAPVASFEDKDSAEKEYFRLCGQAVDSAHITDSVTLLTYQGFELRHEVFEHPAPEPEPEPEPVEE